MKRKTKGECIGKPGGFSLVELLVAMAVFGVVITAVYSLYHNQRAIYRTQDQILEMEQNGRAGMNLLMRELRMAGYNAMGSQLINNLSAWVPAGFIPNSPIPVNLDANPKITKGTGAQPDMITFLSELEGDHNPTSINSAAAVGATSIALSLNASDTGAQYNIGDIIHIGVGSEYAKVVAISENALTIDTNPSVAGNQGLTRPYQAGTPVGEISVVSYTVFNTGPDAANPVLKRKVNAGVFQPVAENISNMEVSVAGPGEIKVVLTARIDKPDPVFSENNGYRTLPFSSAVKLRNSNMAVAGLNCNLPDAPSSFAVSADSLTSTHPCGIEMSWDAVTKDSGGSDDLEAGCAVTGYRIFYDTAASSYAYSVDVGNVTGHSLNVSPLPAGVYYVSVAARNNAGLGAKCAELSKIDVTAPAVPAGLTASATGGDHRIILGWSPNSDCDLTGYRIFRSTDGANYTQIAAVGKSISQYLDIGLTGCLTYSYRLEAVDHRPNASPQSAAVSAVPTDSVPPGRPLNLSLVTAEGTDTLTWDASQDDGGGADDVISYGIYGDGSEIGVLAANSLAYTYIPVSSHTSYQVVAIDRCGNPSEEAAVSLACEERPTVAIGSPAEGSPLSGIQSISGTASPPSGRTVTRIQVRIDNGTWQDAAGTSSWTYSWNTTGYDGDRTVWVYAEDSAGCTSTTSRTYTVNNTPPCTLTVVIDACKPSGNNQIFANIRILKAGNPVTPADQVSAVWGIENAGGSSGPWALTCVFGGNGYYAYNASGVSECGSYGSIYARSPSSSKFQDGELPVTVRVTPTKAGCSGSGVATSVTIPSSP